MSDSVDSPVEDSQPVPPVAAPAKPAESALWREIKGLAWVLLAVLPSTASSPSPSISRRNR